MAVDVLNLWNFRDPAASEERFRSAQEGANQDDWMILETQIARSYGIRKDFERARQILEAIQLDQAGPEPRIRWMLELGRTHCSATHSEDEMTPQAQAEARRLFTAAFELARDSGFHYLAVDSLHMMVTVDRAPGLQLDWNLKAVEYMEQCGDEEASRWSGSLYNNAGYALAQMGRHGEAHTLLQKALRFREARGEVENIRIAHWMIAWNQRLSGDLESALATQLRLEAEWEAAGEPDRYVYEELALLHEALGMDERARHYRELMAG